MDPVAPARGINPEGDGLGDSLKGNAHLGFNGFLTDPQEFGDFFIPEPFFFDQLKN